jgi:hypothetical protein
MISASGGLAAAPDSRSQTAFYIVERNRLHGVRLKKSMRLLSLAVLRHSRSVRCSRTFSATALLMAALLIPAAASAQDNGDLSSSSSSSSSSKSLPSAPEPRDSLRFDAAVSGFAQITGATNGNSIREDTSESLGGLVSIRQPYRPWFGYEANVGYTRYSEFYNKGVTTVQDNVTEFTAGYLLQAPKPVFYQLAPFVTLGGGLIVFSPTQGSKSGVSPQFLPAFVYSLGVNRPVTHRIGLRVQYRALKYKTPNFNKNLLDTRRLRTTMEPSIGVYYRF